MNDASATILHVDMDAFFASVELLDRPELKGLPAFVGHKGGRGVVTSATYEARRLGVRSAMPMSVAMRIAPRAHVLEPHYEKYKHFSGEIMRIFRDVTPLVEPLSIDEALLDISGALKLHGSPTTIATAIRERILRETGLIASVGGSSTKFIAKLASGKAKPDGMLIVPADRILDFLHPLPVSNMWGVGKKTEETLTRMGIRTVRDLAEIPLGTLTRAVGASSGQKLHDLAHGRDVREVITAHREKSIGHEHTFEFDVSDQLVLHNQLLRLSGKIGARLRDARLECTVVAIKVRFSDFRTLSRSRTLGVASDVGRTIYEQARELFAELDLRDDERVRLIGVRAEALVDAGSVQTQPALWAEESETVAEEWRDTERVVDKLSARFGSDTIRPAALIARPEES